MIAVPATASTLGLRRQDVTAARTAWACFWAGAVLCYVLVLFRLAHVMPALVLTVGFVAFHAGLVASCLAVVRGLQRGWAAAFFANGLPVGLFWVAVWSVPRFVAQFQ